jgi:hypothetical protein
MDIQKALNPAPLGLDEEMEEGLMGMEPAIEIEIEDPESVTIGMDGLEITIEPGEEDEDDFNANLAEDMDEGQLTELAGDLLGDFQNDVSSRRDWLETYVDGLELLGIKLEDRTEPWPGACAVYHPLLAEALVKFQSETIMDTFPAAGPVKTKIVGKETPEKVEAAERVREDMNYQLTEEMPEYRPEHERMLWGLGLAGNAFKKIYFDPYLNRQAAVYVPAEDMLVPYGASDLRTAERVTHVMRKTENEIRKLQVSGFYRDVDLGEPTNVLDEVEKKIAEKMGFQATADDRYKILEMHVDLVLPGDEDKDEDGEETGIALPYVVTIDKSTQTVLAIRRNWDPEDEAKQKRQHFVHYGYIPGFGFYCLGLIHLIGAYAKSGTMLIRQLVDAGTLSNLPGGFKSRGLRVKGDDTPIAPAEWRDVDVASGTLRDNILPLPYKEPSQVLMGLMNQIIEEGRRFASAADMKVSDMSAQAPVGTTLAILERTLKIMSAVQARIHYTMKQEFKLLAGIIRDYAPEEYEFDPEVGNRRARKSDYDNVEVIPVSDPNAATMSQKVVQYQAVMQMAQTAPNIYDMKELNRQMCEVLGVKNINKLIPRSDEMKPKDPVSENMNFLNNVPNKAFIYQDHEAHIQTHMAFMQDPKLAALVGQSPNAQQIQAAIQAHIAEHLAFEYRKQIEEQLGVPLPKPDEELPEDVEVDLSRLVAAAAGKLSQKNAAEAQQQQAQQQAQDPLVMIQQKELEIKEREQMMKEQKAMADVQIEQQRLDIERMRIESQERSSMAKIESEEMKAGAKLGMEATVRNKQIDKQQETEGVRMGMDMVKNTQQLQQQLTKQKPQNKE